MKLEILGLSLSSSWGNGHATTWRALINGLAHDGHDVLFLERRQPWYLANQDMPDPAFCTLAFYDDLNELGALWSDEIEGADLVIVGSYVPDGVAALDIVLARARGPVAFYDIDTPVTLAALARREATYIAPRQIPELDLYFSFTGGPTLDLLQNDYGAQRAIALYCSADPELYAPTGEPIRWSMGYLGTYSADRQPMLETLLLEPARRLPEHRFVVAGPKYPASIRWPANVERIEHLPPANHASFYTRQRFTLNVTRADMVAAGWAPSVRLFEAACCGTPVISDPWPGLESLFAPEQEIFIRSATDEVVALLQAPPDRAVGERARQRALGEHTGLTRARAVVDAAQGLPAPRRLMNASEAAAGSE